MQAEANEKANTPSKHAKSNARTFHIWRGARKKRRKPLKCALPVKEQAKTGNTTRHSDHNASTTYCVCMASSDSRPQPFQDGTTPTRKQCAAHGTDDRVVGTSSQHLYRSLPSPRLVARRLRPQFRVCSAPCHHEPMPSPPCVWGGGSRFHPKRRPARQTATFRPD